MKYSSNTKALCLLAVVLCWIAAVTTLRSASEPDPVVRAWAILFQVMERFREYVETKALSSIHNDDVLLNVAMSALLTPAQTALSRDGSDASLQLLAFTREVAALHAAGDAFDQAGAEAELKKVVAAFDSIQKLYDERVLDAARKLANRSCCPMHPEVIGEKTAECPKCGMMLDAQVRLMPHALPEGARPAKRLRATVVTDAPLQIGKPTEARLRLSGSVDQQPVLLSDLREVHTQKIHLLIIDGSLTDYHHEHPVETTTPGEYSFSFTPRKPGPYRAWADVQPYATGIQEYAMADIAAETTPEAHGDTSERLSATVDGLTYTLTFEKPKIRAGEPVGGRLRVTRADGTAFDQLEPVMGTFAHLVAFHIEANTVLHIHPKGTKLPAAGDRGGPELEFQFYAPKAGFYRLFSQVQIGGEQKFAPFNIQVERQISARREFPDQQPEGQ